MAADDSPEQRYNRAMRAVQESILREFPNPERKGCPGDAAIRDLVRNRYSHGGGEVWEHVTHCSPCYREYVNLLALAERPKRLPQFAAIAAGLVIVFAIGFWARGWWAGQSPVEQRPPLVQKSPELPKQPQVLAAVLNLQDLSPTRGGDSAAGTLQRIPRADVSLTIYLPRGSEPGRYSVEVRRRPDSTEAVVRSEGSASIQNGLTILVVRCDLSSVPPGRYVVATRGPGESWRPYSVAIEAVSRAN